MFGGDLGRVVSTDSDQTETAPRKFTLGPLGNLNQVGARICNGLGIMRACLETQKLEQLEARMDEIADPIVDDTRSSPFATALTRSLHERHDPKPN